MRISDWSSDVCSSDLPRSRSTSATTARVRSSPCSAARSAPRRRATCGMAASGDSAAPAARGLPEHVLVDHVVADDVPVETSEDILRGLQTHAVERLAGTPGAVRAGDDVRKPDKKTKGAV